MRIIPEGQRRGGARATALWALAFAGLTGLAGCNRGSSAPPPPPPPEVGIVTVAPRTVALRTELPGRTSAVLVADVRPQVGGIVKSRDFREGGDVRAGQTLYRIDPATYRANVESAQAALAKAQANVEVARVKASRYKELATIDAVSKESSDEAVAAELQAQADVSSAKAALDTARINLDYTRVTAPISGRIGRSSVTPGALVTASQATALATIQQLDLINVDVTQSTSELLALKRELAAGRLKSDGAGETPVHLRYEDGSAYGPAGKLQFADVTVDQTTGAVTLRIVFPNPKKDLLPGMYVRAVIEEGVRDNAITVPQQAVTRDTRGQAVAMVVGADGKVQPRPLKTSRTVGDQWLIDDGLAPGDRVIVEGLQKARPGTTVKAVAWVPKAASAPAGASSPSSAAAPSASAADASPASAASAASAS